MWLFDAGKTHLGSFDQSNNTGATNGNIDGSVLEEKLSFKMLGLAFSYKSDLSSYIISIAKTASMKIGVLIHSMKVLSNDFFCISINLPYDLAWNNVVISGLELLTAT